MKDFGKTLANSLKKVPWGVLAVGGLSLVVDLIAGAMEEKRTNKALEQMVKDEVKKLTEKKD